MGLSVEGSWWHQPRRSRGTGGRGGRAVRSCVAAEPSFQRCRACWRKAAGGAAARRGTGVRTGRGGLSRGSKKLCRARDDAARIAWMNYGSGIALVAPRATLTRVANAQRGESSLPGDRGDALSRLSMRMLARSLCLHTPYARMISALSALRLGHRVSLRTLCLHARRSLRTLGASALRALNSMCTDVD